MLVPKFNVDEELEKRVLNNLVALENQTLIVVTHSTDLQSIIPKAISFFPQEDYKKLDREGALLC